MTKAALERPPVVRRAFLRFLPILGLSFWSAKRAFAEPPSATLSLTAADSLFYYLLLLSQVRGDAYAAAGANRVQQLDKCNSVLDDLRGTLQELRDKLNAVPKKAHSTSLQEQLATLEYNFKLIDDRTPQKIDSLLTASLPSTVAALSAVSVEIGKDCDLDPDGTIKKSLDQIFATIDSQNAALKALGAAQREWQREAAQIEAAYDYCTEKLDRASLSLESAARESSNKYVREAINAIEDTIRRLDTFKLLPSNSDFLTARETLTKFLNAIVGSLQKQEGRLIPALYSVSGTSGFDTIPSAKLDPSNSSLVGYVQNVVHNRSYFSPGIGIQTINCIAVCWPVWVLYMGDDDDAIRRQLIGSALNLNLLWGAQKQRLGEIAEKLQVAYVWAAKNSAKA